MHTVSSPFIIVGADSLSPDPNYHNKTLKPIVEDNGGNVTVQQELEFQYGETYFEILNNNKIHPVRYIHLFDKEHYLKRVNPIKVEYVKWLEKKLQMLKQHPKFSILNTPRAIAFGAPTSLLIFGDTLVQLYYAGGGLIVSGKEIVHKARNSIITDYLDITHADYPADLTWTLYTETDRPLRTSTNIGTVENVDAFETYVDDIKNADKT